MAYKHPALLHLAWDPWGRCGDLSKQGDVQGVSINQESGIPGSLHMWFQAQKTWEIVLEDRSESAAQRQELRFLKKKKNHYTLEELSSQGPTILAISHRILWDRKLDRWKDCHSSYIIPATFSSGLSHLEPLEPSFIFHAWPNTSTLKTSIIIIKLNQGLSCSSPLWARTVAPRTYRPSTSLQLSKTAARL